MSIQADPRYLEPYRQSHARHGSAFDVTLWASPESQRLRFQVFTEMCFLGGRRVLDAGCSRGDFAAYLIERDIPFAHYTGVDGLPEVIEYARTRKLPRCDFLAGDFLKDTRVLAVGDPEVICISGTLNTMTEAQVMKVLEAAWLSTSFALLFNFLSDRSGRAAPPQGGFAKRHSAMRLLDWAMSRTPQVQYRQDYFKAGHDASILMVRE
jgi:SAM-dependent methyltransferase